MTLRELHLFAGIGGGILGGMLLGHRCVGAVEINPHCRRVLEARQCDGILDSFPIHDDIRTFSGTAWRGRVDVVCGGFPCQDISLAGSGAGLAGERSGLWWEMLRVVREVGPRFVFVENVPGLFVRGLDQVLGSLADLGFDAEWLVLSAADCGAPHLRKRVWILARSRQSTDPDADSRGREGERVAQHSGQQGQCGNEPDRLGAGRRGTGRLWLVLSDAVTHQRTERWPTHRASDGAHGGPNQRGSKGDLALPAAVVRWPTPASRDYRYPNRVSYQERSGTKKGEQLNNAVGGALNPVWVEWLMGFPLGWTDCARSATRRCRKWLRRHSAN